MITPAPGEAGCPSPQPPSRNCGDRQRAKLRDILHNSIGGFSKRRPSNYSPEPDGRSDFSKDFEGACRSRKPVRTPELSMVDDRSMGGSPRRKVQFEEINVFGPNSENRMQKSLNNSPMRRPTASPISF